MVSALTERQHDVYRFLFHFITQNGFSPTLEEIGAKFNISKVTAYEHVSQLETKGYIQKAKNHTRSITLTLKKGTVIDCPHCGKSFNLV